jgi:hypothetical protein
VVVGVVVEGLVFVFVFLFGRFVIFINFAILLISYLSPSFKSTDTRGQDRRDAARGWAVPEAEHVAQKGHVVRGGSCFLVFLAWFRESFF